MKIAEADDPRIKIIFQLDRDFFVSKVADEGNRYFPLLRDAQILPLLPVIKVDSGAVKFVCNGANIMRPGITEVEGEFSPSELVVVKDQKYGKAISVGRAKLSKKDIETAVKGLAIENLHYVGDKYWEALKQLII